MKPKKKVKHKRWTTFSVTKVAEGGMGVTHARWLLNFEGVPNRPGYSPYVGESGIEVPDTVKIKRKVSRLLYG